MANNLLLPVTLSQNSALTRLVFKPAPGTASALTPIYMRSIFGTDRSRQAALAVRGETARCSEIGGAPAEQGEKREHTGSM